MEKYKKSHIRTINFKYPFQDGMKNLNLKKEPDGSYSIWDIQDYFEYAQKNMKKRLSILQ